MGGCHELHTHLRLLGPRSERRSRPDDLALGWLSGAGAGHAAYESVEVRQDHAAVDPAAAAQAGRTARRAAAGRRVGGGGVGGATRAMAVAAWQTGFRPRLLHHTAVSRQANDAGLDGPAGLHRRAARAAAGR